MPRHVEALSKFMDPALAVREEFSLSTISSSGTPPASPPNAAKNNTRQREIWLIDTETTGLSPKKDRIVEIAIKRYYPETDEETFSWLINPEQHVPLSASDIHGLTDDKLLAAETFPKVWMKVLAKMNAFESTQDSVCEPHVIVAHNARFDKAFVEAELCRAGLQKPDWRWACSMQGVARVLWPGKSCNLSSLMQSLGQTDFDAHRAANDVEALGVLLSHAQEHLYQRRQMEVTDAKEPVLEKSFAMSALMELLENSADCLQNQVVTRQLDGPAKNIGSGRKSQQRISTSSPPSSAHTRTEHAVSSDKSRGTISYVTAGGKVWHRTATCPSLRRSESVDAVSVTPQCEPCKICVARRSELCAICLEQVCSTASVEVDHCEHLFHRECLEEWRKNSVRCPVCERANEKKTALDGIAHSGLDAVSETNFHKEKKTEKFNEMGQPRVDETTCATLGDSKNVLYGTANGACFHADKSCKGLRTASYVTVVGRGGRRACRVCVVGECVATNLEKTPEKPRQVNSRNQTRRVRTDQIVTDCVVPAKSEEGNGVVVDSKILVTATGSKWHRDSGCYGLRKAMKIQEVTAVPSGYDPCRICAK